MTNRVKMLTGTLALLATLTAVSPAAASASTTPKADTSTTAHSMTRPDAGWIGTCTPIGGDTYGGGWCDGNGPDWVYEGFVICTNGGTYWGPVRWAGDRRGSYGHCPTNTFSVNYGTADWYQ